MYDNPYGGKNLVRFDGIDGTTLIDRKLSFYSSRKGKYALLRQAEAIMQNPAYKLRIEVPSISQRKRVQKYITELGITNIKVKVVAE